MSNKAEELIKKKYKKLGYKCLHNKGFCDFIFFKVIDNKPTDIVFCEVKSKKDRLRYEQQVFRKIIESLNLNYQIEVIDIHSDQTKPNHPIPQQPKPSQTKPYYPIPDHSKPVQSTPFQTKGGNR